MTDKTETEIKMTENGLTPLTSRDESIVKLLAGHEEILRMVEQAFPVKIFARGREIKKFRGVTPGVYLSSYQELHLPSLA